MKKYQLKIKLLSDLCVSDGGVYNSMLDTDICHDEWGFPYIPAKRLKGCLRECALELNDWGMEIPIEKLFGGKGTTISALRLGNAYLENYEDIRAEAIAGSGNLVFHPQNVLNHFSYIRTQTSIDYETGVADDTSLRTMRVVNKGLVFFADIDMEEKYKDALEACCDILRHIGIARTRGLGEVQVSLVPAGKDKKQGYTKVSEHAEWNEGSNYLEYTLELVEPLICKSVNGGEAKTQDYIEGSKILGLIIQQLKGTPKLFLKFVNQELFCSNAYLEYDGVRLLEIPASYYSVKNKNRDFVDKIYETTEKQQEIEKKKLQLNQAKHCYMTLGESGKSLVKQSVSVEERYHHRRPDDKSIGRAYEEESGDSRFYQISSIKAGQVFRGYLYGSEEQMKMAYDCLSQKTRYYLGYGKQAEYGRVNLCIAKTFHKDQRIFSGCRDFIVKLESPTIIYNEKAMYSTNIKDLQAEINAILGLNEKQIKQVDKYVNYTSTGGYNVTWNARKPVVEVFDKGTVLHYQLYEPVDLIVPENLVLGERITEGFGEASICRVSEEKERYYLEEEVLDSSGNSGFIKVNTLSFMQKICDELFDTFIRLEAAGVAKEFSFLEAEAAKPTVSNMILICKESKSLAEVKLSVKSRFDKKSEKKNQKLQIAEEIVKKVETECEKLLERFCERYQITDYSYEQDKYECAYLAAYLNELKYQFRAKRSENTAEGE